MKKKGILILAFLLLAPLFYFEVYGKIVITRLLPITYNSYEWSNPTATKSPTITATPKSTSTQTPTPTITPTSTATPTPPCGVLNGIIENSLTLNPDCNYLVSGNLLVPEGVTLTILSGTKLLFDGQFYLLVNGVLLAQGEEQNPVSFTSLKTNPDVGDWMGIYIEGMTPSFLTHVIIEYGGACSNYCYAIKLSGGKHILDNSEIRHNRGYPIGLGDGDNQISNSSIHDNVASAIITTEGYGISKIINNSIKSNSGQGIIRLYKQPQGQLFESNRVESNISSEEILYVVGASEIITHNLFISNTLNSSTGGSVISLQSEAISNTVKCNSFVDNQFSPNNSATLWLSYGKNPDINNNQFSRNSSTFDLAIGSFVATDINAIQNFWGTTSQSEISNRIHDFYDDFMLKKVVFTPFLSESPLCAPNP
jgi:hypothetical protein